MTADPLSRQAALDRCKQSTAWLAGHAIGAAERKRKP